MIRIAPYYERGNRQAILEYHLNLVADVVPFLPEDVLDGIPEARDSLSHNPRVRKGTYLDLLETKGIPIGGDRKERRLRDAQLAQILIHDYSPKLHQALYGNWPEENIIENITGRVKDRRFLRELFAARLSPGKLPENLTFDDRNTDSPDKMLLDHVFRYDEYSKKKNFDKKKDKERKRDVYQLLVLLDTPVCPYCNRQFITTVADGEQRVRPQLDHFKNKETYPYLALCLNNLIPCCGVCNLLKHNKDADMLYPYAECMGESYVFRADFDKEDITTPLTGASAAKRKYHVTLEKNEAFPDKDLADRAQESIETLALDELYKSHSGYVSDMFYQRYIFTDDFFDDIKNQFPELFKTKEEVKHLVRLMDYSPDAWGSRPLAKLTHDIAQQIDGLYPEIKKDAKKKQK